MKPDEVNSHPGSDAFGVLGWGLRRYWWLVLLSVVVFGVVAPALLIGDREQYDAQAQVGPTDRLTVPNTDLLPRIGVSVFENGAVAQAVRRSFVPPLSRSTSVIPERVELLEAQDNVILTVVGHGTTPESAQATANVAASTLAQELNKYTRSVGSFAVQKLADEPANPVPTMGRPTAIAFGMLAGLLAGLAGVVALLAWRRPVIDSDTAARVTGTPVLARLKLEGPRQEIVGLPVLARRLLSADVDLVFVDGPANTARMRSRLVDELAALMGRVRPARVVHGGDLDFPSPATERVSERSSGGNPGGNPGSSREDKKELILVHEPDQFDLATRLDDSMLLLVVKEGTGQARLSNAVGQNFDSGSSGLVLARTSHWDPRLRRPSSKS